MSFDSVAKPLALLARALDPLQSALALVTRWYVSWQFLKSGWLKVSNWPATLDLFKNEYHVPLLPPAAAAVTGAFGELFFFRTLGGRHRRSRGSIGPIRRQSDGHHLLSTGAPGRGVRGSTGSAHPMGIHAGHACRLRIGCTRRRQSTGQSIRPETAW